MIFIISDTFVLNGFALRIHLCNYDLNNDQKNAIITKLSRPMGKPTVCICENKDADQLRGNREADHAFVFASRIVQFLL